MKLSIIIPVLNEQESIPLFYSAVTQIQSEQLSDIEFEYWFIDDGSTDDTILAIKSLQSTDSDVHYVSFSRNFGKEAALFCGLQYATGDYVAVMDVDLQDPPALLPDMLAGVISGEWDVVGTRRKTRNGEPKIRAWFSELFYKIVNHTSDNHIVEGARDYRVMTRQVVNAILSMNEYNRFSKGIFTWVGFKQKYIAYENKARVAGKTSWQFLNLFKYSIDGIVAFSQTPLVIVSILGLVTFLLSVIGAIFVFIRAIVVPNTSAFGWPSMVVIMLGLGGVQLLSLGIVGQYISKIYLEVKKRPLYLIKDSE
ncbi:glycosyltransferase family 2 protein [Weissella diestrammenae]|uniref:Glycosyltransferase family 2 protein n=1 Tax=Weissella diestrammenae TaxID=1162633 RepID=A0A7G9T554_9LACO|nr:glycosyltransferase family 2 protein [Weissella diestrammenae]MCM0583084.1 glycosyltransferase family 2 protein [Weissella diestrammenae]QNN75229.1 glycosyltransferase family 2 protein [Weissella diestrammenae]